MKKSELCTAFTLHLQGKSWEQIAICLHYPTSTVKRAILDAVNTNYGKEKSGKEMEETR